MNHTGPAPTVLPDWRDGRISELEQQLAEALSSRSPLATLSADLPHDWQPTSANINALPEPVRRFVHDLETRCDPAGDVAALAFAKDQVRQLEASNRRLRDEGAPASSVAPSEVLEGDARGLWQHLRLPCANGVEALIVGYERFKEVLALYAITLAARRHTQPSSTSAIRPTIVTQAMADAVNAQDGWGGFTVADLQGIVDSMARAEGTGASHG